MIADLTRRLEVLESLACESVRIEEEEIYQPERVFVPGSELVTDTQTGIQTDSQTDTAGSPNAATAVEGYVADIITRLLVAAYDGFDAIQSEATYGIELVATSAVSEIQRLTQKKQAALDGFTEIQLEAIVGIELVRDVALEEIEQLEAECDQLALEKQAALDGLQAYSDECDRLTNEKLLVLKETLKRFRVFVKQWKPKSQSYYYGGIAFLDFAEEQLALYLNTNDSPDESPRPQQAAQ